MAKPSFADLQSTFRTFWPTVTLRPIGDVERTVVVVHPISFDVPDQLIPVFPAYEERFLCMVLSLLRAPRSRVIYVTSQPIRSRVLDYYFGLVPELDTAEVRSRFVPAFPRPLTPRSGLRARSSRSASGRSSAPPTVLEPSQLSAGRPASDRPGRRCSISSEPAAICTPRSSSRTRS